MGYDNNNNNLLVKLSCIFADNIPSTVTQQQLSKGTNLCKNLKWSFSAWLTHFILRFLYILGCSGPWCGISKQIILPDMISFEKGAHFSASLKFQTWFVNDTHIKLGILEQFKGKTKTDWVYHFYCLWISALKYLNIMSIFLK